MASSEKMPPVDAPIFDKLRQLVDKIWEIEGLCLDPQGRPRSYPLYSLFGPLAAPDQQSKGREWLSQTLVELQETVEGNLGQLSRQAALLYFRPFAWLKPFNFDLSRPESERFRAAAQGDIMQLVLAEWIRLHPSAVNRALLTERIETLLRGPGAKWNPDLYRPTLVDCLNILLPDRDEEAIAILVQLTAGEYGRARRGSLEEPELRSRAPVVYLRLWEAGKFDYASFRQAMFNLPGVFHDLSRPLESNPAFYRTLPASFQIELQSFAHKLTTDLAEHLTTDDREAAALLKQVAYLEGATWLFLACSYVEEKGLAKLPDLRRPDPASAATRLCQTHHFHHLDEDAAQTVDFLRHYKPATLQAVLPHALHYRNWIQQALEPD